MRTCTKCGTVNDGAHPQWCKKCMAESRKSYYWRLTPEERKAYNTRGRAKKTKKQIAGYNKKTYEKHKDQRRAQQGGYKHGITPEEYIERRKLPCEICGGFSARTEGRGSGQHIDHDHKTDKLRGTLCEKCNRGLGHYDDDPKQLRAAALYLERYAV